MRSYIKPITCLKKTCQHWQPQNQKKQSLEDTNTNTERHDPGRLNLKKKLSDCNFDDDWQNIGHGDQEQNRQVAKNGFKLVAIHKHRQKYQSSVSWVQMLHCTHKRTMPEAQISEHRVSEDRQFLKPRPLKYHYATVPCLVTTKLVLCCTAHKTGHSRDAINQQN